jgi:hypothetical protein
MAEEASLISASAKPTQGACRCPPQRQRALDGRREARSPTSLGNPDRPLGTDSSPERFGPPSKRFDAPPTRALICARNQPASRRSGNVRPDLRIAGKNFAGKTKRGPRFSGAPAIDERPALESRYEITPTCGVADPRSSRDRPPEAESTSARGRRRPRPCRDCRSGRSSESVHRSDGRSRHPEC